MKHLNAILLILLLAFVPVACGDDDEDEETAFTTSSLNGAWTVKKDSFTDTYFIFNGLGGITDAGRFGFTNGTYAVAADGTIALNTGSQIMTGKLSSSSSGTLTIDSMQSIISKLTDTSACEGAWTGSLTDLNTASVTYVAFTVDSGGNVSSFTGLAGPVTGKAYCTTSSFIGFLRTAEATNYNEILLNGTYFSNLVAGTFLTNSASVYYDGTLSLTKAP